MLSEKAKEKVREVEVGNVLEIAGKTVGRIESITESTLLIRKGYVTYADGQEVIILTPQAVYLERNLVENAYWIKIMSSPIVSEAVNLNVRHSLIREFNNM